jgi:hypothetical protein
MRVFFVCVVIALPTIVTAQTRGRPTLILTAYAGGANGHALWTIGRQTLIYADRDSGNLKPRDTVALERRVKGAVVAGSTIMLFPSERVGFSLDVMYRDFSFHDTCRAIAVALDTIGHTNDRLCRNVTASANGGSVIGVTFGTIFRPIASNVSPYIRGALTLASTTISTIAMAAPDSLLGPPRVLIDDQSPRRLSVNPVVALGVTTTLGVGYQLRVEVRDELARLETMDGSVNALGIGPTGVKGFHHFALVLGLDVVFEQKRIRRQ